MSAARPSPVVPTPFRFDKSGALLASLVDNAAIGMVVADQEGRLIYGNRAFGAMLGHTVGDETSLNIVDLVHEEDVGAGRQQLGRLVRGNVQEYRGEHRFQHADGSPLRVSVAGSTPPPARPREPRLIIVQLTDIELQKRAEEALAYSESRWNFALESARQGVWDHDIRNDTMFYSRMWRVMRGLPPDQPVPQDHQREWFSRIHPDDVEHVRANIHRQDSGDTDFDALQYREQRADGSYVWILSRGKPVEWDEHGNAVRTLGTDTDITPLKAIEAELASEKELLRVTLDAIGDGMISTNATGQVTYMNPAAEALTGFGAAEAKGRDTRYIFRLRNGLTGELQECPVAICLTRQSIVQRDNDMVLISRNGRERDIRCTASPIRLPDGSLNGTVLVFQDVSESRAMQRELAHNASHDTLTGLINRAAFDRALNAAIASARDGRQRFGLLYIDLDRFKPVNDTAGHAAGDALLKQVADTIKGACRERDVVARIGGDEFAVLLPDCDQGGADAAAGKIVRAVQSLVFSWAGRIYRVGASVGCTTIGKAPSSPLGFLGEADAACYAAKARGRGTAASFADL